MEQTKSPKRMLKAVSYLPILFFISLLMSSCITSKAALELTESYDYKIKKVHSENPNSTYDKLVDDYIEENKSYAEKTREAFERDTMAYVAKTACFGRCPVFTFTVTNAGNAKYEGINNVEMMGVFESKLSKEQKDTLQKYLDAVNFLKMTRTYPPNVEIVADVQKTKLVLNAGEYKSRTTIVSQAPATLKSLENHMLQLIEELSWVQI